MFLKNFSQIFTFLLISSLSNLQAIVTDKNPETTVQNKNNLSEVLSPTEKTEYPLCYVQPENVSQLNIDSDKGAIQIVPSLTSQLIVASDKSYLHTSSKDALNLEFRQKNSLCDFFRQLVFWKPTEGAKFLIKVPESLPEININCGDETISISESFGRNINISGGNVSVILKNVSGNITIRAGKLDLQYSSSTAKEPDPTDINISCGSASINAALPPTLSEVGLNLQSPKKKIDSEFSVASLKKNFSISGSAGKANVHLVKNKN